MDPHSGFLAGPVLSYLVNFFSKASNLIFCPPCSFESKVETDLYELIKLNHKMIMEYKNRECAANTLWLDKKY
jgi:hypothetical protein